MINRIALTLLILIYLLPLNVNAEKTAKQMEEEEVTEISGEIFEKGGGYLHAGISVEGGHTDNLFNERDNKTEDYYYTISPELWLMFPGSGKRWSNLFISSRTPAGYTLTRSNPSTLRQYQLQLSGRADLIRYQEHEDQNTDNYSIQGRFLYNAKGGLSIDLADEYKSNFDPIGLGTATLYNVNKYQSNLFDAIVTYDVTEKTKLRLGYSNFALVYDYDYDDSQRLGYNIFYYDNLALQSNDRNDNGYSGYVFHAITPKTSLFANIDYIDIAYEQDSTLDSTEFDTYGGIDWKITMKTTGYLKAGYGVRNFSGDRDKAENFILEGMLTYIFSPKVTIRLNVSQRMDESQIAGMDYTMTLDLEGLYQHQLTDKLAFNFMLGYANLDYEGRMLYNEALYERDDDHYRIRPSLYYQATDWLGFELAYDHLNRDSNIPDFAFETNYYSLRISASL